MKFVFFGSADFSVLVLNELQAKGFVPSLVVTTRDKPKGRKLVLTPNVVKVWAEEKGISVTTETDKEQLQKEKADFFLVVAYGKILKKEIFEIPLHKTLNIHPSLLPKYRGASPMISQILNNEKEMGTSIMIIDEGVDSGPVVAQKIIPQKVLGSLLSGSTRLFSEQFFGLFARESVSLFASILPNYLSGKIKPKPQNDLEATYCQKIKKEDGLLDLAGDAHKNLLKIKAFSVWPRTYYLYNGKRIIITDAILDQEGKLKLLKVIPEGKSEMSYEDFLRGQK